MSGTTISTVETVGLVLSLVSQSPVVVTETGALINGSAPVSYLPGYYVAGILDSVPSASILNLGTIEGDPVESRFQPLVGVGIELRQNGAITNGSAADTTALIEGNGAGIGSVYTSQSFSTIINFGTVQSLPSESGFGLLLSSNELVTNGSNADVTALISGGQGSAVLVHAYFDLTNYGTIYGASYGILSSGGTIVNGSSLDGVALIEAVKNIGLHTDANVINYGTIQGGETDDYRFAEGIYDNDHTVVNKGTIIGYYAADITEGTFVDSGVVEGTGGWALYARFGADVDVDPGAVFVGGVTLADDCVLTLESGASAGTLAGFGTSITVNATISFAPEAAWTIAGESAGLAAGQKIFGFGTADTIIIDGFDENGGGFVSGVGLELTDSAGSTITLDLAGSFAGNSFALSDFEGNSTISLVAEAACFCRGTRILTPRGEVAVEDLVAGYEVITRDGEDAAIIWIGRRRIDVTRHKAPEKVRPVRILRDALGEGVPCRDLRVSPDHALWLEGCLIPAKALVNGVNVLQEDCATVEYFHIELAAHDVLFADYTAVESYLDTGNRGAFENGGAVMLHPAFGQEIGQARREAESCAPFVEDGPVVVKVRGRLWQRGVAAGPIRRFVGG